MYVGKTTQWTGRAIRRIGWANGQFDTAICHLKRFFEEKEPYFKYGTTLAFIPRIKDCSACHMGMQI